MHRKKEQPMRKVIAFVNMTLDSVTQAPGRPEEDGRGDFSYGGWAAPYEAMQSSEVMQVMPEVGPLLLGRWTYESFFDFWPKQVGNPFTERLNQMEKYVVSNTLQEPLPWMNSTLIQGDAAEAVAKLKAQPGKAIMVMGSSELIQTLMAHQLVDLYILLIHPLVLSKGRRLFPEGASNKFLPCTRLQLVDARATSKGVVVAVYQPGDSENQETIQVTK